MDEIKLEGRTLRERWARCRSFSREASSIFRQLGFASAAICWTFKPESNPNSIVLPDGLLTALIAILFFFIFDILQYVSGTIIYYYIAAKCEKDLGGTHLDKICKPICGYANYVIDGFFLLKAFSLSVSYYFLIIYYLSKLD